MLLLYEHYLGWLGLGSQFAKTFVQVPVADARDPAHGPLLPQLVALGG